jgi:tetrahydromethanopterin S-methyltransferase subunit D
MYTPNGQLYSSWRVPIDPATAGPTSPFITDITTGPGLAALSSDTTIWGRTVASTAGAVAPSALQQREQAAHSRSLVDDRRASDL